MGTVMVDSSNKTMKFRVLAVLLLVCVFAATAIWSAGLLHKRGQNVAPASPMKNFGNGAVLDDADQAIRDAELDPAKQKLIWDTEHLAFEIEHRFGKPFIKALIEKDESWLIAAIREGFQGIVLDSSAGKLRRHGPITEVRRDRESSTKRVDATGLAQSLLALVEDFQRVERGRLRVLKIDQLTEETNRCRVKLLVTAFGTNELGGPIVLESEHEVECRLGDETKIGHKAIVDRWQIVSQTVRSSRRFLMQEVTQQVGFADLPLTDNWKQPARDAHQYRYQLAVEDFDRDGYLDIAIARVGKPPLLLRSIAGRRFEDVASSLGVGSAQSSGRRQAELAVWFDYDNDGFPDLLLGDRLYHNVAGQEFVDVTVLSGLEFGEHPMGCVVADYDCDGLLDLYILFQASPGQHVSQKAPWVGDNEAGAENQLWRNVGRGRFRNVTHESGASGGRRNTFAASWFFCDADRFPDLYIANDFGNNVLLRNRGDGSFEDISQPSGTSDFATSMGVATGDLDNDGVSEIYVANMYSKMGRRIIGQVCAEDYPAGLFAQIQGSCAGNRLYRTTGQRGRYQEVSDEMGVNAVGWAHAPAMADLDGDGWLDLYSTAGFLSFDHKKPDG